jgi:pyruvate/2-oxoglutarate dehydrogenase complex dihydrolipoamide acyltransferase (E2) component
MPKLGMAMVEGILVTWLVEAGAQVAEGRPLFVVETDKVEQEVEAPISGVLRDPAPIDCVYEVGERIGTIDLG